ncbi:MAG: methyltransferase [Meiothermus sp.]
MKKVRTCHSCGSVELLPFLSFGHLPIPEVLALDRLEVQETRRPLELGFCKRCTLVQLLGDSAFDPARPSSRPSPLGGLLTEPLLEAGARVLCLQSVPAEDLQKLRQRGIEVLYIEPVPERARQAQAKGIPTWSEIFGRASAERLRDEHFRADLILLGQSLAHAADLNAYLEGLSFLLSERGTLLLGLPDLRAWLETRRFDRFSQRWTHYLSVHALQDLLRRHGLWLNGLTPAGDGELRARAGRVRATETAVAEYLSDERRLGLTGMLYYQEFASSVASVREALLALLSELKTKGRRIAAYGAGEAGSLMLNFVGLGREVIEFVVDEDTARQGRYLPGVRVPIYAPARLLEERPDYLLVLGNHAEALQNSEYARRGGRLIVPLPFPEIVNPAAVVGKVVSHER